LYPDFLLMPFWPDF